jgi:hypothetical protein
MARADSDAARSCHESDARPDFAATVSEKMTAITDRIDVM